MERELAIKVIREINEQARRKNVGLLTLEEVIQMSKISGDSQREAYKLLKDNVAYVVRIDGESINANVV